MRLIKFIILFSAAFILSWIVITTFSQGPFIQKAPIRIFNYHTSPIAIYWYIIGSCFCGLLIGIVFSIYQSIVHHFQISKLRKELGRYKSHEHITIPNSTISSLPEERHDSLPDATTSKETS